MPMLPLDFQVMGNTRALDGLKRRLARAPQYLTDDLEDRIQDAGDPVLRKVQAAVRAVHVVGDAGGMGRPKYSRNLRGRIANATHVSDISQGIRFKVIGPEVGAYGTVLSQYMDVRGVWRHPVFGNRQIWRGQVGEEFFNSTIRKGHDQFRRACEEAMRDTIRMIEGG
jgi:hypothetical protein